VAGHQRRRLGGVTNPTVLMGVPNSPGDRIVNTDVDPSGNASNIYTTENSATPRVYVESWSRPTPIPGSSCRDSMRPRSGIAGVSRRGWLPINCGAMYHYDGGPINGQDGGITPKVRADRPPGQWQSFTTGSKPRASTRPGKKIANAKFLRILHNGQLIHENVGGWTDCGYAEDPGGAHQSHRATGRPRSGGVPQHLYPAAAAILRQPGARPAANPASAGWRRTRRPRRTAASATEAVAAQRTGELTHDENT